MAESLYPRECRLALELIERLGRPVDALLLQQNELLRAAAHKYAQGYDGDNAFMRKMQTVVSERPYRLTLSMAIAVLRVMQRELAPVTA